MARVRFTADYNHRVSHAVFVDYKADTELTVPRAHADAAIAAGKAEELTPPKRQAEAPVSEPDDG